MEGRGTDAAVGGRSHAGRLVEARGDAAGEGKVREEVSEWRGEW